MRRRSESFPWRAARCTINTLLILGTLLAVGAVAIILPMLLTDAYQHAQAPLLHGAIFAFLSQLSSLGKGLQKAGVQNLPELTFKKDVLISYLVSKKWRTGVALDIMGALFGLASLTILPISIAQPIFCNGLVLLAIFSHFSLSEQLRRAEWFSIGLCFLGTLLLAVTLVPRDWAHTDIRWIQMKLFAALVLVIPLLALLELHSRVIKRRIIAHGRPRFTSIEFTSGVQAGLCIGVGNASLATGLQSTSQSWRAHLSSDTDAMTYLAVAVCFIVVGAAMNACHPLFANRGYTYGRVVLISTYSSLVSMTSGVFMGVVVLDEAWPTVPRTSLLREIAFFLIFWGVVTLNGKNLSKAWQRVGQVNDDKGSDGRVRNSRASGGEGGHGDALGHKRHLSDPPEKPQLRELSMDAPLGGLQIRK